MRANSRQIISIALLPFVLAASVASLDALVLCTAAGHKATIEVTHHVQAHCRPNCHPHDTHGCQAEGEAEEIRHAHEACSNINLKLNLGDVRDQRVHVTLEADAFVIETPEGASSELNVRLPGQRYSLQHLRSVVLLI